uniref:Deoxyribonuclease-1-like 1 n=1 Tax=Moschus moschiferus TaxID=68415 RepID=A0A8C6FNN3_MOSMO
MWGRPHYKAASEDPPPGRRTRASRPVVPAATPTGTLHAVCPGLHLHGAFQRPLAWGHAENLGARGPKTWRRLLSWGGGGRPGSPRGSPRCARRSRSGFFATRSRSGPALSHGSPRASEPPPPWPPLAPGPSRAGKEESAGKAGGRVSASKASGPPSLPPRRRSQGRACSPGRVRPANRARRGGQRVGGVFLYCLLPSLSQAGAAILWGLSRSAHSTETWKGVETTRSAQILARCDITVLQEVVDSSDSAIPLLLRELNRFGDSGPYASHSSLLLGRSKYKEKYVYIYRSQEAEVQDSYVYDDQDDLFTREPFVCCFSLHSKVLPSLVLVPLHTTPKAVETELNALYDVFLDASGRWQTKDVILLGDFNADCASLTKKRLDDLVLRTQASFHWAIVDGVDTTVRASTHCTYDRIVLHGEHLQSLLRGAAAFNFPQSFGLTEQEALNISDHYPVEVDLALSQAVHGVQPPSLATLSLLLPLLAPQLGLVA